MFAIAFRYLCGWASASSRNDEPEWPPHPDRVFMALTAAYAETGQNTSERESLLWLESLTAPQMSVSLRYELHASISSRRREGDDEREPVPVWVPVNGDRKSLDPRKLLPATRKRDKRTFPAVIPESNIVHLIWPDVDAPIEHRTALDGLCAKVGYIGDTASLVQMWLEDAPPSATLVPTDPAHSAHRLRVPYAGRLNVLKEVHERDMRAGQYLPRDETFKWGHYREVESPEPAIPSSDFGEFIILRRVDGPSFAITDTLTLTQTLRDTVLSVWSDVVKQPIPEWISGHTADGKRSTRAKGHLALVALSNVGFEHSDGDVKGLAMAVPHDAPQDELDALLGALFPWDSDASEIRPAKLVMGRLGALSLAQMNQSRPKMVTLRRSLWLRPAQRWASVTPIVLDRYPKRDGDAENMVAQACQHIGLPTPRDVVLMPGSLFTGAPPAKRFAPLPQKSGKTIDQHTHALLIFDEPVRGPVLLGSGRYRGYGLCRPYGGTQEES